jgi:large subunit ribosomal protein L28
MSRVCDFCGKKTQHGNQLTRRGLAKAKGGVGIKTTGVTRRTFQPNIQKLRAVIDGATTRVKVCTKCLKTGVVKKPLLVKKNQKSTLTPL